MEKRKLFIILLYTIFFLIGIGIKSKAILISGNSVLVSIENGAHKEPSARILQFQAYGGCTSHTDCPYCYQKCNTETNECYDFRPQLVGTCNYYDYCTASWCSEDDDYCYNADPSLCKDADKLCHGWFSC